MPVKKHLRESAAPTGASAILDGPSAAARVAHTPGAITSANVHERSTQPPPPRDSMQGITARLGASYWATNKRFEWARNSQNHHYEFTRYYFEQLVLVDVWSNANPSSRKQSERKRACVDAENARRLELGEKPIGLIAVVRGTMIPDEVFEQALQGQTCALVEPVSTGPLV